MSGLSIGLRRLDVSELLRRPPSIRHGLGHSGARRFDREIAAVRQDQITERAVNCTWGSTTWGCASPAYRSVRLASKQIDLSRPGAAMNDGIEPRPVETLDVPRVGAVLRGDTGALPWRMVDGCGAGVDHVNVWLADLDASDCSPATLRAYAYDLLSWTRFLGVLQVSWAQATRAEVRDWVRWYRCRENPQRRRSSSSSDSHRPTPGSVNERTGSRTWNPHTHGRR